jgi:hypothetical protein
MPIYTKIKFLEFIQNGNNYMLIACTHKWTDGTPFDYNNFYPGEPSCGNEHCVQLITDYQTPVKTFWNDVLCNRVSNAYICKKPPEIVQIRTAYVCESEWTYLEGTQSCYKVI